MKPTCFDVVIMIGVWADKFRYWLMTSAEMKVNKYFQQDNIISNKGYEGQIHIKTENIADFVKFEVSLEQLLAKVKKL